MQTLDFKFETKEVTETGQFSGYASTFGNVDLGGDIVAPGAFTETLKERSPRMLWQHQTDQPIGVYPVINEDQKGLYVEGKLALGVQKADEAHKLLKIGALQGLSIGYRTKVSEYDEENDLLTLKAVDLYEISLVTFPMNTQAEVDTVKSCFGRGDIPRPSEIERRLRDAFGMSRAQAKSLMACGYQGLVSTSGAKPSDVDELAKFTNRLFAR